MKVVAVIALLLACGSRTEAPRDLCLEALKRGPPPPTPACDGGSEPRVALEPPDRVARIPGPGSRSGGAIAERRWCEAPDGTPRGPYVALDRFGRVVESGHTNSAGELDGLWIVWNGEAPRVVGHYRRGESVGLEACDLGGLSN